VSALKLQYAWNNCNSVIYDLSQGHCGGSNFVNFDVNIHISRDGRVCSETNMHERIIF
jgi:hypothetical protein